METIFYDGNCGLCHGFVRFVVRRDTGARFVFAPLSGEHFRATVPPAQQAGLPDSVVVQTEDNRLLVKSAAVCHVLGRMGGVWRALAHAGGVFPATFLDFFYDRIARIRKKLFAAPLDVCPIVPPELRSRFRP